MGEHNTYCKMTLFESATRVPLLIRAPHLSATSAGKITDSPAQLLDLYPTLAELAGLPLPTGEGGKYLGGVSLKPLFDDASTRPEAGGAGVKNATLSQVCIVCDVWYMVCGV